MIVCAMLLFIKSSVMITTNCDRIFHFVETNPAEPLGRRCSQLLGNYWTDRCHEVCRHRALCFKVGSWEWNLLSTS